MRHGHDMHGLQLFDHFEDDPIREAVAQNPPVRILDDPLMQGRFTGFPHSLINFREEAFRKFGIDAAIPEGGFRKFFTDRRMDDQSRHARRALTFR